MNPIEEPIGAAATGEPCGSALHDLLAFGFVLVNPDGSVGSISPEAQRLLGGAGPPSTLPAELIELARRAVSSGQRAESEVNLAAAGGATAPLRLRVQAEPVDFGTARGATLLLNGAACPEAHETLLRLERLASVGTLTASIGHELKNALVATRTFIDLLLEKNPQAELAEVVHREVMRMDSLLNQMLRLVAPSRQRTARVGVHQALDHALRLVEHQLNTKPISLTRDYAAGQDLVDGNDYQLEQAFLNLLLNAVEATPPEGHIVVRTRTEGASGPNRSKTPAGSCIQILFEDTGRGIKPDQFRHLFEPFFTTKDEGTGLGLAITRQIIESHRGSISAESRTGQGSRFVVSLPLARVTNKAA